MSPRASARSSTSSTRSPASYNPSSRGCTGSARSGRSDWWSSPHSSDGGDASRRDLLLAGIVDVDRGARRRRDRGGARAVRSRHPRRDRIQRFAVVPCGARRGDRRRDQRRRSLRHPPDPRVRPSARRRARHRRALPRRAVPQRPVRRHRARLDRRRRDPSAVRISRGPPDGRAGADIARGARGRSPQHPAHRSSAGRLHDDARGRSATGCSASR